MAKGHAFQAPTGTRDFYPQDMLRRRYIEKMWRDTSIRHGFEEIDGPTFEHLDLYTVKSGEGIVNELFSFKRAGGEKDYALRPEFTPTLARMYAAKAGGLAKPTKWFTAGPFFRAERPQRGRLREFLQWNCDIVGTSSTSRDRAVADCDMIACCVSFLECLGLKSSEVNVQINHRAFLNAVLRHLSVPEAVQPALTDLLDRRSKLTHTEAAHALGTMGLSVDLFDRFDSTAADLSTMVTEAGSSEDSEEVLDTFETGLKDLRLLVQEIKTTGLRPWCRLEHSIARGLAYYTGTVFEIHETTGAERAIAGGGRYDNLIELFGGPPTPAVGFGMGDVVLSLVLQDKGLMPEGAALMDKLSEPAASPRPDVFVIANDQPESIAAVRPLVAGLRRGADDVRPLHARHSYKATKNIGKLLQEASACHSRFAAILESGSEATLKNLVTGEQVQKVPLGEIGAKVSIPR